MTTARLSLHVLGPLEVRVGDDRLVMGGAKQRAVLAVLLLRAEEVVPVERLVDEVWGDEPPPSAAHTLESYISRLRQLLNGYGPSLLRRGTGYVIELGHAALDAREFVELQERASLAAAVEEHADVVELTCSALAMWRGPALADVALASSGRAEAERFEELRLRTYELRFDAELALGRHEQAIGELQSLVAQNPYRERFVAQLMLALYRAGRHAEALDAYEQTRRRLDEDLGLQPSTGLRQLSGQIVRQDPDLSLSFAAAHERPRSRRSGRVATLIAGGLAAAGVLTLTASGGTPPVVASAEDAAAPRAAKRVALVLPRDPDGAGFDDPLVHSSHLGFQNGTTAWGHQAAVVVVPSELDPGAPSVQSRVDEMTDGSFDLVIVAGDGAAARALAPLVEGSADTRFAFIDVSLADLGLLGVANATGYPFAEEQSGRLAGYLSGLVAPRRGAPGERVDTVSMVVAERTPRAERLVRGVTAGFREARPSGRVVVDYAADALDRTDCEMLANSQINAGSDVVLGVGAPCSHAALAVVHARGVWGLRVAEDRVRRGAYLLGTLTKYWESATSTAVVDLELGASSPGRDVVLGLSDDYAVMVEAENPYVSGTIWSKVMRYCSNMREASEKILPTLSG